MCWSTCQRMLDIQSHFPYEIIISIRRQTLPFFEATFARTTSQMVIATNSNDPGLFWYIFRHVNILLRSTATNFIDLGPFNYTSATTWFPPRPSTLDAWFPSMVNAASSAVEISHPVTDLSSLVELYSCSFYKLESVNRALNCKTSELFEREDLFMDLFIVCC